MIVVERVGHDLESPVRDILHIFASEAAATRDDLHFTSTVRLDDGGWTVETREGAGAPIATTTIPYPEGVAVPLRLPNPVRREVRRQLYFLLSSRLDVHPPWGALTGIRPTTVAGEFLQCGLEPEEAILGLVRLYGVSPEKATLAVRVSIAEAAVLATIFEEEACIYVSIPLCTSRCSYCSFSSGTVDRYRNRLPEYVEALLTEAGRVGRELSAEGRTARCLYVGGGSPAVLSADLIDRLLGGLRTRIPWSRTCETTFEAGRCDDLDDDRLLAIASNGIGRLCLNPQTTDPETLRRIGRPDPGEALAEWVHKARQAGIGLLNMDVIAGLPQEGETSFARTLADVVALSPENITVHALSLKRGSGLAGEAVPPGGGEGARRGVSAAMVGLTGQGYAPYYLYRQKDTVGGLENTGYARPGTECLYNVSMMSDRRDVFGIGAGASTKRRRAGSTRIDRRVSPREIGTYLSWIAQEPSSI